MTDSDQPKRPTKIDARAGPAVICCVSAFLVGLGLRGLCLAASPGKIGIQEPSHPPLPGKEDTTRLTGYSNPCDCLGAILQPAPRAILITAKVVSQCSEADLNVPGH